MERSAHPCRLRLPVPPPEVGEGGALPLGATRGRLLASLLLHLGCQTVPPFIWLTTNAKRLPYSPQLLGGVRGPAAALRAGLAARLRQPAGQGASHHERPGETVSGEGIWVGKGGLAEVGPPAACWAAMHCNKQSKPRRPCRPTRQCPPHPNNVLACRTSLSQIERAAIEGEINAFDVALGACERITRQAIPMAYTRWGQ